MYINIRLEYLDCNQVCFNVLLNVFVLTELQNKCGFRFGHFEYKQTTTKNEAEVPHYYNKIPAMLRARTLRRELDECNVIQNANLD